MTRRVVKLPQAFEDLDSIAAYLGEHANLETELRFFEAAEETFAFLAEFPEAGPARVTAADQVPGLRQWRVRGFENILVFYRLDDDIIEVIRVLHGARDLPSLLEEP